MTLNLVLSNIQQRALALALLLLPLAPVAVLLVSCISDRAEHHARVATLKREIGEYRAIVAATPDWRRQSIQLNTEGSANILFDEPQAQAAAADLQSRLTTLVTRDGGKVTESTAEMRSPSADEPARLESVVGVDADMETLVHILYDLRTQRPLMLTSRISIQSRDNNAPVATTIRGPHMLHAELNVDAFVPLAQ